ncbi:DNA-directed RNA polymerase III subunit RPC5 [Centropristis striata]|uniref:DNA-directed RNA polymerase III subunit RPC5 n=1 Tax=Centropristis striata TaxID=184440 RepID=UPI0027E01A82|nr:DNA-directed RNA polymerase III subunit RPC5 [Centropristis striata]XP_059180703.1 DNA-directed RNA polymerase III subunit RPC5 [Centropristis striata]XP_059180704.1 DNA-directed RNA polymerase III subunit RPC5 [Centropristis striata]XP_059180705.1 DNA-directed RNA polymerase III subunit RPC5 [Centropristis striata]
MASGDDDDPIIEEIDVYLAKSLADKLYLFQYPVRPSTMTYDDVNHLSARIKPKQQRVELEMAIDTMSPNYCRSKGEQIALNVDGTTYDETNTYSVKMMDKQTFSSIQATTNTSRYAAAVFRKGELHVTPLTGILQMRPSFSYLDKADTKTREREAANEGGDSSQDEAEEDAKAITVRFARPESEQARQRRIQSYEFLQKKQAEEPWVHLHYHGVKDGHSEHERQYLFCQSVDASENSELVKTPKEYLAMLMPPLAEEKVVKPVGPSNVLSMAQLRTLPLGEQVKTLMKNVKVMPFANLMGLLASGTDSTAALRCIQQVALLVQGNWVVKSDVLYPKNTCSPHSGVPAEVLCRGRDFVMWRFTLERSVMRKEITAIIKLPPEDVKEFLEHVAAPRVNRGWEFLLPTDVDFIKKHPDIAHRQHMLWLGIQSKLEKVFNFSKEDFMPKNSPQPDPVHVGGEQRLKMAHDRAQANQSSLQKELDARRAGSGVHIKQEPVGEDEPMDTSSSSSIPNGSVNGYPSDHTNGNGASPTSSSSVELQDFVIKTFRKHFVLTLNEFKRLFSLHLASMPVGQSLFTSISDHMLQDAILLCQCKQIMVPFPAQTTAAADEQKVFGLWETGEDFDKQRRLLYELFNKNYRVRRNAVQTRLAQEFGDVSKSDVDRLLNECCISYAGMWYLKGTLQS